MANRVFLLSTDRQLLSHQDAEGAKVLCAADYMIPMYWMMLFGIDSICETTATTEDGDLVAYPRLSAPGAKSIELARSRWPTVESVIGESFKKSFDSFVSFIEPHSTEYLQVETCELWMMYDTGEFLSELRACLAAFASDPFELRGWFRRKHVSQEWTRLFSHVVTFKQLEDLESIEMYRLCGYSWDCDVPWETT